MGSWRDSLQAASFRGVPFEVMAEIQQRTAQDSTMTEQESNEQTSHTAISIQKGVYCLELRMGQSTLN